MIRLYIERFDVASDSGVHRQNEPAGFMNTKEKTL